MNMSDIADAGNNENFHFLYMIFKQTMF